MVLACTAHLLQAAASQFSIMASSAPLFAAAFLRQAAMSCSWRAARACTALQKVGTMEAMLEHSTFSSCPLPVSSSLSRALMLFLLLVVVVMVLLP